MIGHLPARRGSPTASQYTSCRVKKPRPIPTYLSDPDSLTAEGPRPLLHHRRPSRRRADRGRQGANGIWTSTTADGEGAYMQRNGLGILYASRSKAGSTWLSSGFQVDLGHSGTGRSRKQSGVVFRYSVVQNVIFHKPHSRLC